VLQLCGDVAWRLNCIWELFGIFWFWYTDICVCFRPCYVFLCVCEYGMSMMYVVWWYVFAWHYLKVEFRIWTFSKSLSAWGVRFMPSQESLIEFHFMKNDNKNFTKKCPSMNWRFGFMSLRWLLSCSRTQKKTCSWFHLLDWQN